MLAFLARLLGPGRRPAMPEHFCPTLADAKLERSMRATVVQSVPLPLAEEPTTVTVDLAALRRIRLELGGMTLGWLFLVASIGIGTAGCASGEGERAWSSQLTPELGDTERWRFTAAPAVIAPDGTAELWLERAMTEADTCPQGWRVVDQDKVQIGAPFGGERWQHVMLVECR